mgnify:CR=1 FL=1
MGTRKLVLAAFICGFAMLLAGGIKLPRCDDHHNRAHECDRADESQGPPEQSRFIGRQPHIYSPGTDVAAAGRTR